MKNTVLSYCTDQVLEHDPDRFYTALFARGTQREALLALYAFNAEIARTPDVVTESALGLIRLQWWRERLEEIYQPDSTVPASPVLQALAPVIREFSLSQALFEDLLTGREEDFSENPPETLDDLENYVARTSSSLMALALEICGQHTGEARLMARHGGIACGLAGLMRALPFRSSRHRTPIPRDLQQQDLPAAALKIADRAQEHLDRLSVLPLPPDRVALPALLPVVLARLDLKRIRRASSDVFRPSVTGPHPFRTLALSWAMVKGKV
ncbi:MAG: squalene/phytoene synthase family protein [Pseudomonadota bacterium]|nr:squalene/phytoene synthase family protein [Pseudomonadota bacterium]